MPNKRRRQYLLPLITALLFLLCGRHLCYSQRGSDRGGLYYRTFVDTNKKENPFITLKINPIQAVFNEIPVSVEFFFKQKISLQLQVGYMFPSRKDSFKRQFFESMGTNATTTDEHFFTHLKSPYNNHGLSFKLEIREEGKYLYYAPQFMYKYCYYKEETFPVFNGSVTMDQTESKTSNIFGFGFMMGRQSYEDNLVLDWYGGLGFRINSTTVSEITVVNPVRPAESFNRQDEDIISLYPFLNLGLRVGIKLGGN